MKNKFKNKLKQKIFIAILVTVTFMQTIFPNIVNATDTLEKVGGILFEPIQQLVVGLGDSIMSLMQWAFMGDKTVVIKEYKGYDETNILFWDRVSVDYKYTPNFKISPGAIFSNQVPAFDINFFDPMDEVNNIVTADDYALILSSMESFISDFESGDASRVNAAKQRIGEIYNLINSVPTTNGDDAEEATKLKANAKTQIRSIQRGNTDLTDIKAFYNWVKTQDANAEPDTATRHSTAEGLRDIIAYWYSALRIIATLGLLCVLVYIGIKILISSAAADKSKYKELFKDWFIAMCLLFFMHYFMTFTITVIESITDALSDVSPYVQEGEEEVIFDEEIHEESGVEYTGDLLMGQARIKLQMGDTAEQMSFTVIYIVLVVYTFVFAIIYTKRVIYMAFLTMIAPLVAMTYPIDKIKDGKAQAFEMWMKEYVYNALLYIDNYFNEFSNR